MIDASISSGIDWSASTYAEVVARHRFVYPERFNVGVAACDRHAGVRGRLALTIHRSEDGGRGRAAPAGDAHTTFDELAAWSDALMLGLHALGVERSDRVGVLLPQSLENALTHLAVLKLGAISVPLSPHFGPEAVEYRLAASGTKVLVTDARHQPTVDAIRSRLPDLRAVVSCDEGHGVESFWTVVKDSAPRAGAPEAADTSADDPAMLIYTSGTTGLPKGALHAHRFLPGRLSGFELIHRLESQPSAARPFFTPADWAWIGGLVDSVLTPWIFGCPVLGHARGKFDPVEALALVTSARVRSLFLTPTALNMLRRAPAPGALEVESVHVAGEPLGDEGYAWARATFGSVYELYGLTEMGAVIGDSPFHPKRPGSMGLAYPGHEVALLDERGDPVARGQTGEIAIRRGDPGMFLGYFGDPEATDARFRGDWLVTGDLARQDEDGFFHYEGRADDVFNTAGYRVGPTEIEAAIERHPAVQRAAVVGEPDPERGAIVKAFVLLASGVEPSVELADEIGRHVRERVAAYARPRKIVFVHELPITVSGKVRRAELREAGADARWGALVV